MLARKLSTLKDQKASAFEQISNSFDDSGAQRRMFLGLFITGLFEIPLKNKER